MSAVAAARLGDEVAHGFGLMAMVAGAVVGAVIGAAVIGATVATGGAALAIMAGSIAAGGLGLAQIVKGVSTIFNLPEPTSGVLALGSRNIRINGRPAMRAHLDIAACSGLPMNHFPLPAVPIAEGSATVRFNGQPAARLHSKMVCGAHIKSGSPNVRIGGPTARTDFVWDVEQWAEWSLMALGVLSLGVAGRMAWLAGGRMGLLKFSGWVGGGLLGFEGLGQLGDRLGPGYRDVLQGVAALGLLGASAKNVIKSAKLARVELLKNLAENRIDEINITPKSEFPNSRRPVKTSSVIDKTTGKVYQADSGYPLPKVEEIHPALRERMPNPSLEKDHVPENCAEFKAVNNALKDGATFDNLELYTINRHKVPAHRCANCVVTTEGTTVISDVTNQPGGKL